MFLRFNFFSAVKHLEGTKTNAVQILVDGGLKSIRQIEENFFGHCSPVGPGTEQIKKRPNTAKSSPRDNGRQYSRTSCYKDDSSQGKMDDSSKITMNIDDRAVECYDDKAALLPETQDRQYRISRDDLGEILHGRLDNKFIHESNSNGVDDDETGNYASRSRTFQESSSGEDANNFGYNLNRSKVHSISPTLQKFDDQHTEKTDESFSHFNEISLKPVMPLVVIENSGRLSSCILKALDIFNESSNTNDHNKPSKKHEELRRYILEHFDNPCYTVQDREHVFRFLMKCCCNETRKYVSTPEKQSFMFQFLIWLQISLVALVLVLCT